MVDRPKPDLAADIADAIDWWREAGVDCDFIDEPMRWLAPPAASPLPRTGGDRSRPDDSSPAGRGPRLRGEAAAPSRPAEPTFDRSAWPQELTAFAAWWLDEPKLDDGRTSGRVPPRGRPGAELMVIVPDPERDDRERLLSGPQGRLLDAMLAAMGIAPEATYVASVLPRHMPMADWSAVAEKGFDALLRHHIKLAEPKRLVAFGNNILPLLGHDPAHNHAVSREFNQEGMTIPLLAGKSLSALLERPRWKAGFWQGWLDWTNGQ